jgi:hypothetical protein
MPATVFQIMQDIDALFPVYDVPETVPNPLMWERQTHHRLQLKLTLQSLITPRFIRSGS